MSDFSKILSAVKQSTDAQTVRIFVPSLGEVVFFRPLTAKQQKDLVKTSAEKDAGITSFYECLNSIITSNSTVVYEFLASDRNYIITMLRAHTLSPDYKKGDNTYDLTKLSANTIKIPSALLKHTVTTAELCIDCKIPTLKTDSVYNNHILKGGKRTPADIFGDLFIYEVAKYVERVYTPDQSLNVILDELSVVQRYQLVETLPAKPYNMIIEFINTTKIAEEDLFKVDNQVVEVDIDQGFFTL